MLNNYIQMVVSQRLSFNNVRELGTCLALVTKSLNLSHTLPIQSIPMGQFVSLATTVLVILEDKMFEKYHSLLEVVCQLLTQFNDRRIAQI